VDPVKAKDLESKLRGHDVGGFSIESLIDHGKSAAVFRARGPGGFFAVKIFDDELIEKYGDRTQLKRIERELTLVGHDHPNLVKIHGGGVDPITSNHYIIMEYLDGPNLKKCLAHVPNEVVPRLVEQLASAARFLEGRNLAHRDIKPENIVLLDGCTRLKLLDMGVLRPIGEPGLTDNDAIRAFVGTLQYSSPEFLLREEEDTLAGWRSLTFYQIGGVIHDLVMRRPLFEEFAYPYAKLVLAVQREVPVIQSATTPTYLVELAKRCLLKDPALRARFVKWTDFEAPGTVPPTSAKDEVERRVALSRAALESKTDPERTMMTASQLRKVAINFMKEAARTIRSSGTSLPPISTTAHPKDGSGLCVAFASSEVHGLPKGLFIYVQVEILDPEAKAIAVHGYARLHLDQSTDSPSTRMLYEGIYDGGNLYGHFEEFIYSAVSWAQTSASLDGSTGFWPSAPE
jgi:eukaryotic-like serine/threonine-protein kinase